MPESTIKPKEVQILGNKVYIRSNIQQIEKKDEMNNVTTIYTYNEEIKNKDEYIEFLQNENKELDLVVEDLTQLLIDKGVIY